MSTISRTTAAQQVAEAIRWCDEKHIHTIIVGGADTYGIMRGKFLPRQSFVEAIQKQHDFALSDVFWVIDSVEEQAFEPPANYSGYFPRRDVGYPDIFLRPDLSTLRPLPWLEHTAMVLGDYYLPDGSPVPISPRHVLRRVVERARTLGFEPYIGLEYEFYLLQETSKTLAEKGFIAPEPLSVRPYTYGVTGGIQSEHLIAPLRHAMAEFGIEIEASNPETGNGQFEINLHFAPALEAADEAFLYKTAVKQFALSRGLMATFMAKPQSHWAGNSCHLHQSLWHGAVNAFYDENNYYGFSDVMRKYAGGQMTTLSELTAFYAPTPNSYKRYVPYSWASTTATWGIDNRTTGLRAIREGPQGTRLENRLAGGDANPYIVAAAAIAGGLYGIEHTIAPPELYQLDAYAASEGTLPPLPRTLGHALDCLANGCMAKDYLGQDFVEYYRLCKQAELRSAELAVTDWDVKRYMEML